MKVQCVDDLGGFFVGIHLMGVYEVDAVNNAGYYIVSDTGIVIHYLKRFFIVIEEDKEE